MMQLAQFTQTAGRLAPGGVPAGDTQTAGRLAPGGVRPISSSDYRR